MNISIVKQVQQHERRVPLVPAGVHALTGLGHVVHVESSSGLAAGFTDEDYADAGANIVYSRSEAAGRADLVLGISPVQPEDISLLVPGDSKIASKGNTYTVPGFFA